MSHESASQDSDMGGQGPDFRITKLGDDDDKGSQMSRHHINNSPSIGKLKGLIERNPIFQTEMREAMDTMERMP